MRSACFSIRIAIGLVGGCVGLFAARSAPAQTIDLSLNVLYSDPANVNSGGTWELVAKSSHSGIVGLSALLTDIATAQRTGPHGTVNGNDPAGFSRFHDTLNPLGFRNITVGHLLIPPNNLGVGDEQSAFYGVGVLAGGAPNFPGRPPGTTTMGPAFTSLTLPSMNSGIPWATINTFNDPAWSTAARLASGTFASGFTPGFFTSDEYESSGNVFTTVGTSSQYGNISLATVSTIVRTNVSVVSLPDYNRDGTVDAADYMVWRNTLGDTGPGLPADGNGDNVVNQADYLLWRANFGATVPSNGGALASSSAGAVPEPAGAVLLVLGGAMVALSGRPARGKAARYEKLEKKVPKPPSGGLKPSHFPTFFTGFSAFNDFQ